MMRYTRFVFDIDNMLTNTTGAVLHGLQGAPRDVTGEHWGLDRLTPVLDIPGLDAFERLGAHPPEQIFQIYPRWEQYEREYQYTVYLYEGIVPLLDSLREKGRILGIIASKTIPQHTSSLFPFQISEYFQTIITTSDTVRHKPGPELMLAYMGRTGVCLRQILYIGDSVYDMQYAAQAGVDPCLALWGCHYPDDILSTHRFEEPAGMMRWLK